MDEVVNLLAPGNPAATVIGEATIADLPDERFPDDLRLLAPVLTAQGRYFQFVPGFVYGPQQRASYMEILPRTVRAIFI